MAFTTTNPIMGVVIFAMFWHNDPTKWGSKGLNFEGLEKEVIFG
jgi:hypothetical protein